MVVEERVVVPAGERAVVLAEEGAVGGTGPVAMGRGAFNNITQYYNTSIISSSTYCGRCASAAEGERRSSSATGGENRSCAATGVENRSCAAEGESRSCAAGGERRSSSATKGEGAVLLLK